MSRQNKDKRKRTFKVKAQVPPVQKPAIESWEVVIAELKVGTASVGIRVNKEETVHFFMMHKTPTEAVQVVKDIAEGKMSLQDIAGYDWQAVNVPLKGKGEQVPRPETEEQVLGIPVTRVSIPCEECGSTAYPNLKYSLVGISVVLCRTCLETVIGQVNIALQATGERSPQSCERCGRSRPVKRVSLADGSQASLLCEECVHEVISKNTAFQVSEQKPTPYEVYREIPIYLYQDEGMSSNHYGAMVEWYNRLEPAHVEDWQEPTLDNTLVAARGLIDLLLTVQAQGHVGPDGYLKQRCSFCDRDLGVTIEHDASGKPFYCCGECWARVLHGGIMPDDIIPVIAEMRRVNRLGEKPYTCSVCSKPLSFPEALFYQQETYCSEHLPRYDKHEQW